MEAASGTLFLKMIALRIFVSLYLFLLVQEQSYGYNCNVITCSEVWVNSRPSKILEFYTYINKTQNEIIHTFNWVWPGTSNLASIWDVLFKEEKLSGVKSGRVIFLNKMNITFYINWTHYGEKFVWTSTYKKIPEETWTITLCFKNSQITFAGHPNKWNLNIGNITINSTTETGSINVGKDYLSFQGRARITHRYKRSPQSETEGLDDEKKQTVWNQLKGYFKELFDKGPNDQRGWLTRIADWILGFLERLLT